jgi:hypothetical protein
LFADVKGKSPGSAHGERWLGRLVSIEVGLLAFPFLEIFQNIDPLPYAIPVFLWLLLLLAAAGLYFRPHVTGAFRRVVAVFE